MSKFETHEFDDHFMVKQPNGGSFPIAKKGLSSDVLEKLKSFAPVKMADGGIVPNASPMPEKGSIEDLTLSSPATSASNAPVPTALNPITQKIDAQKDYLLKLNPGLYASVPDQLDKDAQNMVLQRSERDDAQAHAAELEKAKETQKTNAENIEYNARAQKYGLPLRPVSSDAQVPTNSIQNASTKPTSVDGTIIQNQANNQPGQIANPLSDSLGSVEAGARAYGADANNIYSNLQTKEAELDKRFNEKREQIDTEGKKLSDDIMTGKVNPDHYWDSLSAGNKLKASFAIILGGIASGITGKGNAGLEMINSAIDRDIAAQKENINTKQNLLAKNLDKFKNMEDAIKATKSQLYTAAQAQMSKAALKLQTPIAVQAARAQALQMQTEIAKLNGEVAKTQAIRSMTQGGDATAVQALDPKDRERYVPGEGFALSAEGAKDLRKLKTDHDTSVSAINRLIEIRKKYGRQIMPGEVKAEAENIANILQGRLRTFLVGPGAVSETEREMLKKAISDPTKIASLDSTVLASLSTLKKSVAAGYQNALVSEGVKQAATTFRPQ